MDFSSFFNGGSFNDMAQGLAGLYGAGQSMNVNNQVNQQVQPQLQQNQAATQNQISALEQQINQNRQQAQDMYQRSLGDVTSQNQGLEGNIGVMTQNLNNLSDPNSPFMAQARQGVERKDAAAGRRSQWGEREVQLAALLSDQIGKYAPGINQSITGARDQINRNNQGLASLYAQANAPADRNTMSQIQALRQQLENASAQNTTGRQAANANVNAGQNMIQQGIKGLGGLASLFGSGSRNSDPYAGTLGYGTSGLGFLDSGWGYGSQGLGNNMGFTGGGVDTDYLGLAGNSSLDQGMANYNPYGFTSSIGGWGSGPQGLEGALDFNDPNSGFWD